jgi:mannose-1-phosphate guanylyltransferase
MSKSFENVWSIVLAGGEGERTRAFVTNWLGYHKPKQYCAFTGTRSLFQHTVDRADALSCPERRVVIAAPSHRNHVLEQLRGRGAGRVVFQPENRGTAAGVFLALTYVFARDLDATVVIYPSDHFVYPESAFLNEVRKAVRSAERQSGPVLLGVRPSAPEPDYGWILPSTEADLSTRRVAAFLEKPDRRLADEALRKGGLWNTFILASRLDSLWTLGFRFIPEIMPAFVRLREAVRAGRDQAALEKIYQELPSRDLSSDVLARASDELRVLEMHGVWWNDWGRPERILETLRALGQRSVKLPEALELVPKVFLSGAPFGAEPEVSDVA